MATDKEIDKFLGHVREKGFDLELATAHAMKTAGFWVGQSIGVTPFEPPRRRISSEPEPEPEHEGREVDVVAMIEAPSMTFAFVIECKSFHRCQLGVLEIGHDDLAPRPTDVLWAGKHLTSLTGDIPRLSFPSDVRAFKLVAKSIDDEKAGKEKANFDPAWNAIRQVLDGADDANSLPAFGRTEYAFTVPVLVVDAPLIATRLDVDGTLRGMEVNSAVVRVAAHRGRTHREVYVVTRAGLPDFAVRSAPLIKAYLAEVLQRLSKPKAE